MIGESRCEENESKRIHGEAIFAADVAGFSTLVAQNEIDSLEQLKDLREILDGCVYRYNGSIASTAGDGVLARFKNSAQAVQSAVEIQAAHAKYHDKRSKPNKLQFRIGLNLGDATVKSDGDIFGHDVSLASRLEALAQPGGINLSKSIFDKVQNELQLDFSKVSEHYLPNSTQPIIVYSIEAPSSFFEKIRLQLLALMSRAIPRVVFFAAVFLVLIKLASSLLSFSAKDQVSELLKNEPNKQQILEFFDLVTTGSFGSSDYYGPVAV